MGFFRINVTSVKNNGIVLRVAAEKIRLYSKEIDAIKCALDPSLIEVIPSLEAVIYDLAETSRKIEKLSMAANDIAILYENTENRITHRTALEMEKNTMRSTKDSACEVQERARYEKLLHDLALVREEYLCAHNDEDEDTRRTHMKQRLECDEDISDDLAFVMAHDKELDEAAKKYGIEKEMLQAILLHEKTFSGADDLASDVAFLLGIHGNPSSGCCQAKLSTAIDAYNWYLV